MVATTFDIFGIPNTPTFILCNPNKEQLYALGGISERKYNARFNSLSEISFRADEYIDGLKMEYYDYLVYRRLIYIEELGYFMIREVSEENDGIVKYKEIMAQSLEIEFMDKKVSLFTGTYKFYDTVEPASSFLYTLIGLYMPGWTIDSSQISSSLLTKYRTFDISDTNLYNLLMTDAEEAYQCVFFFDTVSKTVWAKTIEDSTIDTGIYLSHNNLIQNISIKESTDELVTSLTVLGGGDVDIRGVNPLGTNNIYNFDYFATTDWMDIDLITAIQGWQNLLDVYTPIFDDYTVQIMSTYSVIAELEVELANKEAELAAKEELRLGYIQTNNNSALQVVTNEIATLNSEIQDLQEEIDDLTNSETNPESVAYCNAKKAEIHGYVSFETNFDDTGENSLLKRLQPFIIQSSYINENLTINDIMSASAVVEVSTELMEQAQGVLDRISQPRYTFELNAVNFLAIPEFEFFQEQFELGAILYLEVELDRYSRPFLLGYDINYDDPTDFKMIFGNRLRLNDEAFQFSDLLEDAISAGTESKVNSQIWNSWGDTYKDPVSDFISSSLNAALNNVISGDGQDILIDAHGLRGRQSDGNGSFEDEQLWMVNNMLAFTDDGWQSAKMAIGEFKFRGSDGESQTAWGIVADHIVGRMLIGNELYITNESPTGGSVVYKFDATGATMVNASLTMEKGISVIQIDPDIGIKIKYGNNTNFHADMSGNVTMTGTLYSGNYSYIKANGTFWLGDGTTRLKFENGVLDFNGKVSGALDWSSLVGSLPSDKFSSSQGAGGSGYSGGGFANGAIPGDRLTGVSITGNTWHYTYWIDTPGLTVGDSGISTTGPIGATGRITENGAYVATQSWSLNAFAKINHTHDWTPGGITTVGSVGPVNTIKFTNGICMAISYGG